MLDRSFSGCTRTRGGKGVSRGSGGSVRISGEPPKRSCCTTVLPSVRSGSFCVDCSVSLLIACSLALLSAHTYLRARTVFHYSRLARMFKASSLASVGQGLATLAFGIVMLSRGDGNEGLSERKKYGLRKPQETLQRTSLSVVMPLADHFYRRQALFVKQVLVEFYFIVFLVLSLLVR